MSQLTHREWGEKFLEFMRKAPLESERDLFIMGNAVGILLCFGDAKEEEKVGLCDALDRRHESGASHVVSPEQWATELKALMLAAPRGCNGIPAAYIAAAFRELSDWAQLSREDREDIRRVFLSPTHAGAPS